MGDFFLAERENRADSGGLTSKQRGPDHARLRQLRELQMLDG